MNLHRKRRAVSAILSLAIIVVLLGASAVLFYMAFFAEGDDRSPLSISEAKTPATASPEPAAETAEPEPVPAPAEPPPAAEPAPPPEPKPPPPQRSIELDAFVESMEVTGIRISDTGNRATIDGRLRVVGDKFTPLRELELIEVAPRHLVFRDKHGFTYRKGF